MPQPIRKYMPEKASYAPPRPVITAPEERALKQEILRWRDEVEQLANHLSSIQIQSMKPNKTGRRIVVRARIGGKAVSFSIHPFQGEAADRRTFDSLWQEVALTQLNKLEVGTLRTKIINAVRTEAANRVGLATGAYRPILTHYHAKSILCDFMRDLVPVQGTPFAAFHEKVLRFVRDGGLDEKYDRHQVKRALEQYQDMAIHALRHGARMDEMQTILDEAVVLVTLES